MKRGTVIGIFFTLLVVTVVAFQNCGRKPASQDVFNSDLSSAVLWTEFATEWDDDGSGQGQSSLVQGTCFIPKDAPPHTNTECTIEIPEEQLFLSRLSWTTQGKPGVCDILLVQPYYYLASMSAGFTTADNRSVDCSADPIPKDCYGGVGTKMISSFPAFTGRYATPSPGGPKITLSADSANYLHLLSNRWTSNYFNHRMTDASMIGDGFVGGTMQDYEVACETSYGEKIYSIRILIKEMDTPTGPNSSQNKIDSWFEIDQKLGGGGTLQPKPTPTP